MRTFKINKARLLCGIVIILQLLWLQKKIIWPSLSGTLYQIIYYMKYFGSAVLLVYTLSKHRDSAISKRQKNYIRIFLPLFLIYALVEIVALFSSPIVSDFAASYWTRFLAYVLDKVCILIMISCIWLLLKEKAVDCITSAFLADGILIFLLTMYRTGIGDTLRSFLVVFRLAEGNTASSFFEVHELTFCLGLCIIYYLFFKKKKESRDWIRIILLMVLFVLGGKRIGFAGIAVAMAFALFIHRKGLRRHTLVNIGIAGTVICIVYVALLYSGDLLSYLAKKEVNVMGRDIIFSYFLQRTKFSYDSLGWGLYSTSKAVSSMSRFEMGNLAGVAIHNDILKIYIECGFLGSMLWYLFNLVYVPVKIFHKLGKYEAALYMSLIIFAFITYLTDNTENYFVFQVTLLLIPLVAVRNKEVKE